MTTFLKMEQIVPIHGLVQLVSNSSRTYWLIDKVKWKIFCYFAIPVPLGGLCGYIILTKMTNTSWLLIVIVVVLLYAALKPKKMPELRLNLVGFGILGFIASLLSCLIGATGPLLAPFFVREDWDKESIVATKAVCQTSIHLIKIPVFLKLAFPYFEYFHLIGLMVLGVMAGTRVGIYLLQKIHPEKFFLILRWIMFLVAIRVFFRWYEAL
jgi:uncharacterized membrane protein YfcA